MTNSRHNQKVLKEKLQALAAVAPQLFYKPLQINLGEQQYASYPGTLVIPRVAQTKSKQFKIRSEGTALAKKTIIITFIDSLIKGVAQASNQLYEALQFDIRIWDGKRAIKITELDKRSPPKFVPISDKKLCKALEKELPADAIFNLDYFANRKLINNPE